ncbi:hypothetical protein ACRALDRAFT_209777 [Sodiomyces alcalophilus JCM 7366]|uniref:uncharacterized protein n=1 Tax=Sodiomyces alcalophilus JCM 7366 TaxID=591952 RepID=UPI0039B50059
MVDISLGSGQLDIHHHPPIFSFMNLHEQTYHVMLRRKVSRVVRSRRPPSKPLTVAPVRIPSHPTPSPPTPSNPTSNPAPNASCLLLNLIPEILLLIRDRLGDCDQFRLSQTCRALRRLVHRDWRAEFHLPEARRLLQIELAHTSPNLWICDYCDWAHGLNLSNTPSARSNVCGREQTRRIESDTAWTGYWFDQKHVQVALKLCRLPLSSLEPCHIKYLEDIMAPQSMRRRFPGGHGINEHYRARPRIIHRSFYL